MTGTLSFLAKDLFSAMGRGARLRVPHDGGWPQIFYPNGQSVNVEASEIEELKNLRLITKLTEYGVPPPEERAINIDKGYRIGWREAGYDGDVADWWVLTQ
jgi:hypothetical protein